MGSLKNEDDSIEANAYATVLVVVVVVAVIVMENKKKEDHSIPTSTKVTSLSYIYL